MKKILSILTLLALATTFTFAQTAVEAAATTAPAEGPVMTFETTEVDYGTIQQNGEPLRKFSFTNTGTEPLVIKHAKGSCGCTVPTYPKEPILPGETADIEVRYDTKRIGKFTKTVTLTTNETVDKRVLRIKGEVLKPAPEPDAIPSSTGGFN
ncbi:MAG: DUF1573 domain-containing protein [Saprospiraceae bacterium]